MKNVLVVGASSSVGAEISSIFSANNMRVIGTYASSAPSVKARITEAWELDIASNDSIESFKNNLNAQVRVLDVVILLPAVLLGKSLSHYTLPEIDHVISTNVSGYIKLIHHLFNFFHGDSRLILFSSIAGQRGSFDSVYATSKGALLTLVKSLIHELPKGARINAIAPGLIQDSAMFKKMTSDRRKHHQEQIPSGSLLRSTDLARIVFDLCQDHWKHLNGTCVDLNGGQYVR